MGLIRGRVLSYGENSSHEDTLDATFCACLADCFRAWSCERNEMIGTRETGYIINPKKEDKCLSPTIKA
jgi:predicted RNase H-like nuclease